MNIRPFRAADLAATCSIQATSPCAAQWRPEDYSHLAESAGGMVLVADAETISPPRAVGFIAFHRVAEEAELRNMAVSPDHRRRGVGRALLREGLRRLRELGTKRVFLEVRPSNRAAVGLYSGLGFQPVSTRKNYYPSPDEDACVMALDLQDGARG